MDEVPALRRRRCNEAPVRPAADYVLYWMTAARRTRWNFAFDRAVEWARELRKPLVVFEGLRADHRWASARIDGYVVAGMQRHRRALARTRVRYYPYVEPRPGAGKGLLQALAQRASVVVTDHFPCYFLPRMVAAAARALPVRLEEVDSNGLLPLRAAPRAFPTAHSFRRFLQKELPGHLAEFPRPSPLRGAPLPPQPRLPREILQRWPALAAAPPAHPDPQRRWRRFLEDRLALYPERRNHPDDDGGSGLSPDLHFGHLASHQVFAELMAAQDWEPGRLAPWTTGSRTGWWGVSEAAEAFLDQLVTWRELGFNGCAFLDGYDRYASLPDWARQTLEDHARDPRQHVYTREEFEQARTHDALWNAAQVQLVREGRLHNYLRMLWGKKILAWSRSPRDALAIMIELNNKYALDGRDPNSYSGIFWVLGRYDRPWGPERLVFGKVRYMSSRNTARKLRVKRYLERYGAA
ncbi:MAG: deoxyribodipyrimidine photolyase [Planctomycetota bacterium]|jgi:deoxyribodipyrimidine photo-lyase